VSSKSATTRRTLAKLMARERERERERERRAI